jgi:hypothetical protein
VHRTALLALLTGSLLLASCQQASRPAPGVARSAPVASLPPPQPPQPAPIVAWTVPPAGLKTPMAGEPDAAALGSARLVAESCSQNQQAVEALVRSRVDAMRAAVEQAYSDWKAEPTCEELHRSWILGDAFGSGGMGLSGVGEGGGGRGEGIGLGSIGTIGHGSGSGSVVTRARSASGTNDQVQGVDEADIVKNDGAYVYIVSSGALRIVEALHPRLLSVMPLSGDVRELLVQGDRAVAFVATGGSGARPCTYGYDCSVAGDGSQTRLVVLDVADREHPRVVRRIDLSGSLIAARRIGNTVHTVVADGDAPEPPYYETWPSQIPMECRVKGMDAAAVRARFTQLEQDDEKKIRAVPVGFPTITEHGVSRQLCEVMHTPLGDGKAFTSVVSFDLRDDRTPATTAVVQSRPGVVFASEQGLYFSVTHRRVGASIWYAFAEGQDELSDVHKFHIGKAPGETRYVGSGVVPGHVLNQFAMDEWYGYLRVATTRGHVPDPSADSSISVLAEADGGSLVRIGAVDHLAPGEDIRAIRFDGDRGYVVTFKKTDPLFVLDLHDPETPAVLGELEIPGFSTYLHRIDPTHLLSIGFDANDHGSFAFFDGVILQIFDVTRPTEPVLLHREKIGTRGSSSEAATDHLAFNYFAERNLLAIPMTVCEGGGDGTYGDRLAFSGLLVYDVTVDHGFRRLGGVDHGTKGASCNTWWAAATSHVKRSIFMDDLVFSIATDRMKVQRLDRLGEDVGDIALAP